MPLDIGPAMVWILDHCRTRSQREIKMSAGCVHINGEFVELDAYAPLPDDWVVIISDVQGSTRAIEAGQYKKVNMVGASSIAASIATSRGRGLSANWG